MEFGVSEDLLKTIGTALIGAIGFKIVERFLSSKNIEDTQSSFLTEIREELSSMRDEVNVLKHEVTDWRTKYYVQMEINTRLQGEITVLRNELDEYKSHISNEFDVLPPKQSDDEC